MKIHRQIEFFSKFEMFDKDFNLSSQICEAEIIIIKPTLTNCNDLFGLFMIFDEFTNVFKIFIESIIFREMVFAFKWLFPSNHPI